MLGTIIGLLILVLVGLKFYMKSTTGICRSLKSLNGKTVIVTGSNTGIGFETAKDLAGRGARVILACRNFEKATFARDKIILATGNYNITVRVLDLSSTKSIRQFTAQILKSEKRLDILVNNAGMAGYSEKVVTDDGLEYQMASNHFGPFLLTNLLLGLLKKSAPSRIVVVSSLVHRYGTISLDNLNSEKSFDKYSIYNNSKLANVLFTKELAKRLEGTGVTANCLHPGVVSTEFLRNSPKVVHILALPLSFIVKTPFEGAQTSIYCAVSDEVAEKSGLYFSDCKEAKISAKGQDVNMAKKLWEYSERKVGLKPDERF